MVGLTVNSFQIATADVRGIWLSPAAGAFELKFSIEATIDGMRGFVRWVSVFSARCTMITKGGTRVVLGSFLPDQPFLIRQMTFPTTMLEQFSQILLPQQLVDIERHRAEGDLQLEIELRGTAGDDQNGPTYQPQSYKIIYRVPESVWVTQLNDAKAFDLFLLEFPIPITGSDTLPNVVSRHLRRAHERFMSGFYRECVAECRHSFEEMKRSGSDEALRLFCGDRNKMDKDARAEAIAGVIHHYTHVAAHAEIKHGDLNITRGDAKLVLALTASLAAHRFSG